MPGNNIDGLFPLTRKVMTQGDVWRRNDLSIEQWPGVHRNIRCYVFDKAVVLLIHCASLLKQQHYINHLQKYVKTLDLHYCSTYMKSRVK